MKKTLVISTILCFYMITSFAQYDLTIKIKTLQSNKGEIHLYLFDKEQNEVSKKSKRIENNECTITIENLDSGQYAFKYFHDENNNSKLDCNWMGIPKEGYGFSNNATGKFGPPPFEQWIFKMDGHKKVICYPKYNN